MIAMQRGEKPQTCLFIIFFIFNFLLYSLEFYFILPLFLCTLHKQTKEATQMKEKDKLIIKSK